MAGRRVLITGVANPFGARLAARLAADAAVERVVGVDTRPVDPELAERIDVVAADLRSAELPPLVRAAAVDTVVHNDIVQSRNRAVRAPPCTTSTSSGPCSC